MKYLVELLFDSLEGIYKNGKLTGYVINASDNVEAEFIEDGAWMILFLDLELNIVAKYDETA